MGSNLPTYLPIPTYIPTYLLSWPGFDNTKAGTSSAAMSQRCNTARSALLHAAMLTLPGLHCCTVATLRHGSTTSPCFCVVGSRPWHYPLLKRHLPDGAGLLGYRWWNRWTKSWAWTRFSAGSQVALERG